MSGCNKPGCGPLGADCCDEGGGGNSSYVPTSAGANFCSFGKSFQWDGEKYVASGSYLPNGTYNSFTLTNGCVTAVSNTDPCANCGGGSGGESADPISWCVLGMTYTYHNGVITKTGVPVPNGTYYQMAVVDGCVIFGDTALPNNCPPNECCEEAAEPGAAETIELSEDPCNMTTLEGGALMTRLSVQDSPCIQLEGCGSLDSPLKAVLNTNDDTCNLVRCTENGLEARLSLDTIGQSVKLTGCGTPSSPLTAKVVDSYITNLLTTIATSAFPLPMKDIVFCENPDSGPYIGKELRFDLQLNLWCVDTFVGASVTRIGSYATYAAAKTAYAAQAMPACPPVQGA